MKTGHAKQQLDYGLRHGYDTLILSINQEDPANVQWVSTMDMRRALTYLENKVEYCFLFFFFLKKIP